MSLFALMLLFISAILHASWNLLLKQAGEKYIAIWGALLVSSVCSLPILIFRSISLSAVWPYLLASAVFEVAYLGTLTTAYRDADFSLIYPLARGTAPAFLMMWAILFLGEHLRFAGYAGLTMIVIGLVIIGSSAWRSHHTRSPGRKSMLLALLTAVFISLYSVVDGAAVQHNDPASYTILVFALITLFLTPIVVKQYGVFALCSNWKSHWQRMIVIGLLNLCSYMLVLSVYSFAQVSYAGAIREISVVIAALMGWLLLQEQFGKIRVIGSLVVFAGILVVAVMG
jgi:uncharacterized membrane protein